MKTKIFILFSYLFSVALLKINLILYMFFFFYFTFYILYHIKIKKQSLISYKIYYARDLFDLFRDINRNEIRNGFKLISESLIPKKESLVLNYSFFDKNIFIYDKPDKYMHDLFVYTKYYMDLPITYDKSTLTIKICQMKD